MPPLTLPAPTPTAGTTAASPSLNVPRNPNPIAGGSTNAPGTGLVPGGVDPRIQANTSPQSMVLRTAPQVTLPGSPYGAVSADSRPY